MTCEGAWWAIGATVFCSTLAAVIAHYLTKDRDAQTRKAILEREADVRRRHFRKHVLKCRYILERTSPRPTDEVWQRYTEMAPDFLAEAALVDGDFRDSNEFNRLVQLAGEWTRDDAEATAESSGKDLRDTLRDSICDVYNFISTTKST